MKVPIVLRILAALLACGTVGVWVATGSHTGWTKNQITTMETDAVTGLEYPVVQEGLVLGVERLAGGLVVAAILFALSYLLARKGKTEASS
jgi:hypothetical protein